MIQFGSPSPARTATREPSRTPGKSAWAALARELDRWARAGRRASLWWRDDDAVTVTPALDTLLTLSERHGVPLALAVIPDGAEPALADRTAGSETVTIVQHGFAHRNHAPAGEKKAELGEHRDARTVAAELKSGYEALSALFGNRFYPAMVPPWNRIGPQIAAGLGSGGYRGLSTFGPRPAGAPDRVNTHVDIIDWHGDRGFVGEEACLEAAIAHLSGRRTGRLDPDEPTGLLTHHLVHDAACWRFLDRFLAATAGHEGAMWLSAADAFGGAGR